MDASWNTHTMNHGYHIHKAGIKIVYHALYHGGVNIARKYIANLFLPGQPMQLVYV